MYESGPVWENTIILAVSAIYLGSGLAGIHRDIYVHGLGAIEAYSQWHDPYRFLNFVFVAAGLTVLFVVLRKMYGKF